MFFRFNNWHSVRSERYKYASYYEEEGGPYEVLFDLEKDPTEFTNLANNPEYASVLRKMRGRMQDYFTEYPKAQSKDAGKQQNESTKAKK